MHGFLHWGGNFFTVNPYEQSCVCMMNEDYELIQKLKEKDSRIAEDLVHKIARGYKDYEKDIKVYRQVKEMLLQALNPL